MTLRVYNLGPLVALVIIKYYFLVFCKAKLEKMALVKDLSSNELGLRNDLFNIT